MSANSIVIDLATVPSQMFKARIKEYSPPASHKQRKCPTGAAPPWVIQVTKHGQLMSLPHLVDHAGSHFVDSVNPGIFKGGGTQRQKAAALAWALISMVRPSIDQGQLWVKDPQDQDIKRLCSEILGVGAALHLLTAAGAIDFRTIDKFKGGKKNTSGGQKKTGNFDYEAFNHNGQKLLIEAKGTFNGKFMSGHRKSIEKKLGKSGFLKPGAARGYSSAIGIIFATWSTATKRGCDVELLDPEHEGERFFEEHVRQVIRFYARRFAEFMGEGPGAVRLFALADSAELFAPQEPLLKRLGTDRNESRAFFRVIVRIRREGREQAFMGGFWEGGGVELPYSLRAKAAEHLRYAFTGIDLAILQYIRERRFKELLDYRQGDEELFVIRSDSFQGQFSLDEYGTLRGWMNEIPPPDVIFDLTGKQMVQRNR